MTRPVHDAPEPARAHRATWMRRLAPFVLVVGCLAATAPLLRHVPRERQLEVRLDNAETVIGLDLAWIEDSKDAPGEDDVALQASSWRFAPGAAPRSVHTTVRLPDGPYGVDITVVRTHGGGSTRRAIMLDDAERIMLPVR
jgi:hypothetical protein